jgi:protein involved in polysaccharide export with SLBB domain
LLALALIGGACRTAPDKRVLQYLNQDGFGHRYVGNAEEEDYVTIGDTVSFVDEVNRIAETATIAVDGTILVKDVGPIAVAGYTRSEIEALLTQKLGAYYERTDITVRIGAKGKQYYVFGEVGGAGPRAFTGDLTIFEAVMLSGPNQHSANLGRVKLIRPDPVDPFVMTVNVGDMLRTGDSTFNVRVQERDIIVVPPTMIAQLGYFLSDLVFPLTQVFQTVFQGLFAVATFSNYSQFYNSPFN